MSEGQFNFSAYMRDVCERAKKEKYILERDELFPGEGCGIEECEECARQGCEVGIRLSIKDIKKLVVQCIHNRIAWQFGCLMESELAFSEYVRHPLTKCKYGYYYGEHPKLTDAQIAARLRAGQEMRKPGQIGGSVGGRDSSHAKAAEAKHAAGEKTTVPDFKRRPDYTGPDGGEKRIRDMDLIRDLLIAEARPDGADMPLIAGVLINRFQSPEGLSFGWGSKRPKIVGEVITAPGQFSGFGPYDDEEVAGDVWDRVSDRKHDSDYAEFIQTAENLAKQIVKDWDIESIPRKLIDKSGNKQYPYFFRTEQKRKKDETEEQRLKRQAPGSIHETEIIDSKIPKKSGMTNNIFYFIKKRKD